MATESVGTSGADQRRTMESLQGEPSSQNQRESRRHLPRMRDPFARVGDQQLVQGLGWFSVGLGITALLAPRSLGALTGIGPRTGLLRFIGLRELAAGAGLLSSRRPAPWLWSRVAGDAIDLLVLGASAARPGGGTVRSLVSMALVAGVTAADVSASLRESSRQLRPKPGRLSAEDFIERSTIINRSREECYAYWRDLANAPRFMQMVESITPVDEKTSRWVAKLPGGARVEWQSRITDEQPGERIAWHSIHQAPIVHAGVVTFEPAPGNRGTVVRVVMHYRPPTGPAGAPVAKALGFAPVFEIREDLRRFKQILETGEIPTTRGQPAGRRSLLGRIVRSKSDAMRSPA